jgi:hypothetical protein
MQLLGVRRAKQVDYGKRTIGPNANGVDDQRIAFVMADGIAMPGWPHLRRMRLIHAHAADCGFRFNPAGCSEMKPAGIPI